MIYKFMPLTIIVISIFWVTPLAAQTGDFDDLMDEYADEESEGLALVLLVSNPNRVEYVGARGLANLATETPIQTTDRFRIGSITKTFVAVVTLQLVEEGILSLDDTLASWVGVDIAENIPYSDEITLHQLLQHTSGVFDYTESDTYNDAVYDNPSHAWTAAETIRYIYDEEPYFAPDEGWYYSNSNYNLMQIIIENATRKPLADVLTEHIFIPLGMTDSFLESPQDVGRGMVHGYGYWDEDTISDLTFVNDALGLGDGGIISTTTDMEKFARGLFEGDLLSPASYATMSDFIEDDEGNGYGLGLGRIETEFGELLGHDGSTGGFNASLNYHPKTGGVLVAFTNNFDSDIFEDFVWDALYLAFDEE